MANYQTANFVNYYFNFTQSINITFQAPVPCLYIGYKLNRQLIMLQVGRLESVQDVCS